MRSNVLLAIILPCLLPLGCQSVEKAQGTAAGYKTARFVKERPNTFQDFSPTAGNLAEFNRQVQSAITSSFQANGIPIVSGDSDLLIAYLLIRQGNASTAMRPDYFGYGRDAMAIVEEAHRRGVIKRDHADVVDDAAIVIDILDARTDKLVFRNYAKRPVISGLSASARQERVNQAVAEALAPFFR